MKTLLFGTLILLMSLVLLANPGFAENDNQNVNQLIDDDAMSVLLKMALNLSTLKKAKVKIKSGYDAVQDNGQKIEFDSTRIVKFKRPNMCRIDVTEFDGSEKGFVFNGNDITAYDTGEKVYATTPKPGTCNNAIEYFKNELKMPLPLSDLFDSQLPDTLRKKVMEGYIVEESGAGGAPVSHLAFRTDQVDFQVWVDTKKNLPRKLIISYINAPENPQYWAYFKDWDISPWLRDSEFSYKPPKGYEKIVFSPAKSIDMKEEKTDVQK